MYICIYIYIYDIVPRLGPELCKWDLLGAFWSPPRADLRTRPEVPGALLRVSDDYLISCAS